MTMSACDAMLHLLAEAGVKYLFGNPGTTELPLSDALVDDSRIKYILGLQEVPVMAMADGFAQASRSPGVVNVHISCGLGNAMGMLYNAHRAGTPLILTAGQQDRRLKFEEPILWSDMVRVARPWTKWAFSIFHRPSRSIRLCDRRSTNCSVRPKSWPKRKTRRFWPGAASSRAMPLTNWSNSPSCSERRSSPNRARRTADSHFRAPIPCRPRGCRF